MFAYILIMIPVECSMLIKNNTVWFAKVVFLSKKYKNKFLFSQNKIKHAVKFGNQGQNIF